MSCPPLSASGEWTPAERQHLASCANCRRAAITADPILAFSLLPARPIPATEVDTMRDRVRASLRASRVEGPLARQSAARRRVLSRAAAAAAVLLTTLGLSLFEGGKPAVGPEIASDVPVGWRGDQLALDRDLAAMPVLEVGDGQVARDRKSVV